MSEGKLTAEEMLALSVPYGHTELREEIAEATGVPVLTGRSAVYAAIVEALDDIGAGTLAQIAGLLGVDAAPLDGAVKTWSFFGHWDVDRIVVEWSELGARNDDREDTGEWPEGLWSSSGTGVTKAEAEADARAQYELDVS